MESPDPAHRAQRHVHRARPVDAVRERIGLDPVARLGHEFGGVLLAAGEPVRNPETREMLAAAQLPGNLHVCRLIELAIFDVAAVRGGPLATGLEVRVPRQRRAERLRTRPEQIELMAQNRAGCALDFHLAAGILRHEPAGNPGALRARDEERSLRQIAPRLIDVAHTEPAEQGAIGHQPRIHEGPRTPGAALRGINRPPREVPRRTGERSTEAPADALAHPPAPRQRARSFVRKLLSRSRRAAWVVANDHNTSWRMSSTVITNTMNPTMIQSVTNPPSHRGTRSQVAYGSREEGQCHECRAPGSEGAEALV